ncbi:GALE-like protein [Mya arenaria]|uniref:UDP-glucose 4-epimerase n=1 Tax=Mya arenaria TaxID=6604 RepID=A0ABY7FSB7_MYAAR|nr:GALE-like protein [Mya arenaria]
MASGSILVTGGAGYVGTHTVVELLDAGYDVIVMDNLHNASMESIKGVEEITGKTVATYSVDLLDKDGLRDLFKKHKIYCVMHFAGLKAVGESCQKPLMYYKNNIAGTVNLLEVMKEFGVYNMIFSSSTTVYGSPKYLPIDEKHPVGKIGEDPKGIPNNLMPYISQVAVGRLKELTVHGNDYDTPDGTGVRDYIHVVDLAQGHVAALKRLEKGCGCKIPYKIAGRRAGDIASCYADAKLAQEELGWTAKLDLARIPEHSVF